MARVKVCTYCRPWENLVGKVWQLLHMCVCVHACACVWVWYKHVCTTGRIIKVSNYRQTNELSILFSQTNEWADFDGSQRRPRNVWRAQTVAWETDDTSLKWFISAQLNDIMLTAISSLSCLWLIEQSVLHAARGGAYLGAFNSAGTRCTSHSSQTLFNLREKFYYHKDLTH